MSTRLALIRYLARDIYLDPNEDDLGFSRHPGLWDELRTTPEGRRRSISRGELQCQGCVSIGRASPWVHLREQRDGSRQIVHHGSAEGPCHEPESDEHKAWKERVAADAQRAGYSVVVEATAARRAPTSDVVVHGDGLDLGWRIQLSRLRRATVVRHAGLARRDGLTPSWLTTDGRSPLVDRVPWTLANDMPWQTVLRDRSLRVAGGVYRLRYPLCKDLGGVCPDPVPGRLTVDCGKRHSHWEAVRLLVEELVGATAGGVYVPMAIPTPDGGVVRRWVPASDRERYAHAIKKPCTEETLSPAFPGRVPHPRTPDRENWNDSPLHTPGQDRRTAPRRGSTPLCEPRLPVHTISAQSATTTALLTQDGCLHGCAGPARLYLGGWRCPAHAPRS
ncbi:hypothetical protein [Nocardiopsis ansamitocini]|uniref:Competence protein CoiA-like protein n=1 Tax=Nocardiopsis ansamitocini TaxID=1670832 RepID=A0A9W6P7Y1_9ACTN|nr:hypothetical protein [Nocardiopsis ansamitocini]GLU49180.1 hypothetical protein Nans01_35310 [Nocardiopsis ansamitocini]